MSIKLEHPLFLGLLMSLLSGNCVASGSGPTKSTNPPVAQAPKPVTAVPTTGAKPSLVQPLPLSRFNHSGVFIITTDPKPRVVRKPSGPLDWGDRVVNLRAMGGGVLAISNNCLVFTSGAGAGPIVLPIFPSQDIQWYSRPQTPVYRGKSYRIGDKIDVGGGSILMENVRPRLDEVLKQCKPDGIFLVAG
jgi:hypothetical protein